MIYFFVFFIGACIGSFFKLVVDRYGKNESIIFKPSYCPECKKQINWWHNIPLLSYLILRGKCFFCNFKLESGYFITELVTGILTLLIFIFVVSENNSFLESIVTFYLAFNLILLSMFDLKHRTIPHQVTYSAIVLIIIFQLFITHSLKNPFVNLAIAFLFMDIIVLIGSLIKKFKIENNIIFYPLFLWTLIYFFFQNGYLLLIPLILFFFLAKYKQSLKYNLIISLGFIVLFFIQAIKIMFFDFSFDKLVFYLFGIGIIYFVCEIMFYFYSLLCSSLSSRLSKSATCSPVTNLSSSNIVLGGGDVTVFVLIAVFLGYKLAFICLFLASFLALISHFICLLIDRLSKKTISAHVPFVPYLSFACFIILLTIYER